MIDEARLDSLLNAYFDQALGEEETRELEAMLLQSSRARYMLHQRSEQHGLLREWALRENGENSVVGFPAPAARRSGAWLWLGAGIAACLALAFLLLRVGPDTPAEPGLAQAPTADKSAAQNPVEEVALLAEQIGVEWADGNQRFETGSALPSGRFAISKGLVRIDFYSGAKVYLEGPASLELVSPNLARLTSGKLTADVPPPAHGFTVLSESMRIVDRGTEFGMSVGNDGGLQVHVFDGEVELYREDDDTEARSLYGGGAVAFRNGSSTDFPADRNAFASPKVLSDAVTLARDRGWQQWKTASVRLARAKDTLVYYDFSNIDSGSVTNRALHHPGEGDGVLIGCEPVPGRWAQKAALGFARTSDRVRFRLESEAPSVTMLARVRVDSLPHDHNALLSMSPGEIGEIHWKLDRDGRLLLGLRAHPDLAFSSWERLESPPVVSENDLGHWMTFATVIDGEVGEMRHYLDGREVAAAPIRRPTLVKLGKANLGNFDSENQMPGSTITRNFNGRFEEFALFTRVLSAEELKSLP